FGGDVLGERGSSSGGGGEGGVWEQHKKQHQPRALKQNADGSSRQRQAVPTFGRHGKGKSGGGPRSSGQGRSQLSPTSPKPSMGSSSPLPGGSSYAFGDNGDDGSRGDGDERKFGDDARESGGSSATGVRSRARVLAQQREIQQRKRRQQALSSGGIRASDAPSLSRGLVSSGAGSHRRPSLNSVDAGDGGGPAHPSSGDGDQGPEDSLLDGNEEPYNSFSPSVKQFSAPRQVEGDAYTAFNSNDPRHAAAGRMSGGGMSEFEKRRSIGQVGLSDSEDEEEDRDDDAAFGRGRRRRNKNKAAPDMGLRSSNEGSGSASPSTPFWALYLTFFFHRGTKPGHPRDEESRRNKSKPGDWDDRNRPSTKSYKWGGRDSGDEQSDDQDRGNGTGRAAWRSVGREENSGRSPPRSHNASRHSGKPRGLDGEVPGTVPGTEVNATRTATAPVRTRRKAPGQAPNHPARTSARAPPPRATAPSTTGGRGAPPTMSPAAVAAATAAAVAAAAAAGRAAAVRSRPRAPPLPFPTGLPVQATGEAVWGRGGDVATAAPPGAGTTAATKSEAAVSLPGVKEAAVATPAVVGDTLHRHRAHAMAAATPAGRKGVIGTPPAPPQKGVAATVAAMTGGCVRA
ncbi:unnamed protein product, partial [Ectocarpus sp. 8 AP-2014]